MFHPQGIGDIANIGRRSMAAFLAATCLTGTALAQNAPPVQDALQDGFSNPPASARPRVWWHWMNGNVSKDGIAKDLEWMRRIGIGGLQAFDANLSTPQIVDKRLAYMTPEWKDAFRFSAELADKNGLELAIAASPGWSETGGPWVKPENGMKKLVWSELEIAGGKRFAGALAAPPSTTGPFQDLALVDDLAGLTGSETKKESPTLYRDVAVLAYPVKTRAGAAPSTIVVAGKPVDMTPIGDASYTTAIEVPGPTPDSPTTIEIGYAAPTIARSLTLFLPGAVRPFGAPTLLPVLEAQRPDGTWRKIADVTISAAPTTISFAPVTASRFRIVIARSAADPGQFVPAPGAAMPPFGVFGGSTTLRIADLRLAPSARINQFEVKAGYSVVPDYYALDAGVDADATAAPRSAVIDLTARMKPDGTLDWTPPKGNWRIVRMGWSLTGKTNHPATDEATGLEVDKYDGAAVRDYLAHYIGMYRDTVGADLIGGKGVRALVTDSIEVGASNWTPRLLERFRELRGYDATPYLPTLTGAIIGSRAQSDAFLFDFRRTLADLIASEHYGTVAKVAHENGLKVYGESLEGGRPSLGDDLAMRRYADVPMAALWAYTPPEQPKPYYEADMKGAASVAHFYGQNIAAAESMTSGFNPWAYAPSDLRRIIDLEFARGINRPVIHTSVHQPTDDKVPGLSLLFFGQYFNRHETWADMAGAWVDYIARSSFMLQQGRDVADVAYFYGEEAPSAVQAAQRYYSDVPTRNGYDFVNADGIDALKVDGGDLISPGGAQYRLLFLGGTSRRMSLPTLKRLANMVEAGATIAGSAPEGSPSLGDDPAAYDALVKRLWSGQPVTRVGKGRVVASSDVDAGLASSGVKPDYSYAKAQTDSEILFVHRRLSDGDSYFVVNRRNRAETTELRFRVTGKAPEIWHADTGKYEPASYRIEGDETVVPIGLAAEESLFVVFRSPAIVPRRTVTEPAAATATTLDGAWQVAFQPDRGAPAGMTLPALAPLSDQANPGVKYFSGLATYTKSFTVTHGQVGKPLLLDLGRVADLAEVSVNGKPLGTVWHAPYRIDIGTAVKPGKNTLAVRVANLWVNRLIGDAQPGATKITWTALPTYTKEAPLRPSGLIGPVTLSGLAGSDAGQSK